MANDIEEVKKAIEKVEQDILGVERELKESVTGGRCGPPPQRGVAAPEQGGAATGRETAAAQG